MSKDQLTSGPDHGIVNTDLEKALAVHKSRNFRQAEKLYQKILEKNPQEPDALHLLGVVIHQQGTPEKALGFLIKAIKIINGNPIYYNSLGAVFRALGKYGQSISCFHKAIQLSPRYVEAHYNLGTVFQALGSLQEAIHHYRRAIKLNPGLADAHNNLGAALNDIGQYSDALKNCLQAIRLRPQYPEALNNLGNAYKELGQIDQAILAYRQSNEISGGCSETYGNLGNAFFDAGQCDEALENYNQAILMNPSYGKVYNNLGTLLRNQRKLDEAAVCFQKAISLMPTEVEAHHNLGNIHYDRGKYDQAISCYERALSYDAESIKTLINLGICYKEKSNSEEAVSIFERIVALYPSNAKAHCHLIHEMYQRCQWDQLETLNRKIDEFTYHELEKGQRPKEMPFLNLIRRNDPSINFSVARGWSGQFSRPTADYAETGIFTHEKPYKEKITIGYLSNNFRNHPTAHLIWRIFEHHDKQRFNVNVYSYGEDDESDYRKEIKKACDKFVDIRPLSHWDAAKCINDDHVDILIDLVGYMRGNRLEIAALRPAPIQVRWLGLAGTTGAEFFDYLITDRIITPLEEGPFYSEYFVFMPDTYQVNSGLLNTSDVCFERQDANLPENGFIYCCFCSSYKIDPIIFNLWMDILKHVSGSVLWLMKSNDAVVANLKSEAEKKGVDPLRLVFAEKMPKEDHLERLKMANIALDTIIVNGAATTSDALWAEVPVLTIKGTHFASRMTASILKAIGLEDLAVYTKDQYRQLAIDIGNHPSLFNTIKKRLHLNRFEEPLFDTKRFVKKLEIAYLEMWESYRIGENPHIINVKS